MAFDAKRYDVALEHFEAALALGPDNPSILRNICSVHQAMADELADQGKWSEAIAQALEGVKADPGNPAPLAQAGAYCLKTGQTAEAVEKLEAALKLEPKNQDTRFLLGEAYYELNDLTKARGQWEAVLKAQPKRQGLKEKLAKLTREAVVEKGFNQYASGHFRLSYAKTLPPEMRATVFAILEAAYKDLGAKLGGLYPSDPVPVVLYDEEQFTEATGSAKHVGALYDGKIRAPITRRGGRYLDERVLRVRLTHEYVHVLLVQFVGPRVPWWLNEGLAETFSREMDRARRRVLQRAYRGKKTYTLAFLEGSQLGTLSASALSLAYAQAHATADHLWKSGGSTKLVPFLKLLKSGTAPEEALQEIYGMDYARLEHVVTAAYR